MRVPVPDDIPAADALGRVHFVGIGGAGLSGIARIMLARGIVVSGSDARESRAITALIALGAQVYVGHRAEQVAEADTLVVSTAVRADNPEVVEAQARGLRILPRSAALDSVMRDRTVVAVEVGYSAAPPRMTAPAASANALYCAVSAAYSGRVQSTSRL